MTGKNKIKYLKSLKIKKFRDIYGEYIIEGDKIINEMLEYDTGMIKKLVATKRWLTSNSGSKINKIKDVIAVSEADMKKISSFKTSGEALAVIQIPVHQIIRTEIISGLSLVLDKVQDPGNMGNIIRIADWFGIRNIFCSFDCVDCYNPKVVQATMGAIIRIKVHYLYLAGLLEDYSSIPEFNIYGTFLKGRPVYDEKLNNNAFIMLGNESKGISDDYLKYIKTKLVIPKYTVHDKSIDSLNISAAAAIVCSEFRRKRL